jgi:hypothetical protein
VFDFFFFLFLLLYNIYFDYLHSYDFTCTYDISRKYHTDIDGELIIQLKRNVIIRNQATI